MNRSLFALVALICFSSFVSCNTKTVTFKKYFNRHGFIGTVDENANYFNIKFHNEAGDIALNLDARFTDSGSIVALNSYENNSWGEEIKKSSSGILKRNSKFEIVVLIESEQFLIKINNENFIEFPLRMDKSSINQWTVSGDAFFNRFYRSGKL